MPGAHVWEDCMVELSPSLVYCGGDVSNDTPGFVLSVYHKN